MKRTIFESMFSVEQPKTRFKWLFFPVSLLLHGVLVAAIVAVPLMMADNMPVMKITDVFMVAPTPPAPPGPPKGKSGSKKPTTKPDKPKRESKPSKPKVTGFIAPPEIPDEIPEEALDIPGMGDGYGDEYGEEGVEWGETNRIFEKEVNPNAQVMPLVRIEMPKLIKRVAPQYPPVPMKAHIQGVVVIGAVTDIYGHVVTVRVVSGHPLLRNAAVQAVKQWIYEPYMINGIPKPVSFTVSVSFKLRR